jgi:hypothetical protein
MRVPTAGCLIRLLHCRFRLQGEIELIIQEDFSQSIRCPARAKGLVNRIRAQIRRQQFER